ncbi:SET domain-containing protein, partial [Lentinula edodes]
SQVVSQGRKTRVMLKQTDKKGWGVFACERIPKGTFIGIYSGELLGHEESEERAIKYDQFGRTYLFDIDWCMNGAGTRDGEGNEQTPIINHSCDPNAALTPVYIDVDEIERPLLTIFSKRDIHPHEEITFSYSGDPDVDDDDNKKKGKKGDARVHVDCECGAAKCKGKLSFGFGLWVLAFG